MQFSQNDHLSIAKHLSGESDGITIATEMPNLFKRHDVLLNRTVGVLIGDITNERKFTTDKKSLSARCIQYHVGTLLLQNDKEYVGV